MPASKAATLQVLQAAVLRSPKLFVARAAGYRIRAAQSTIHLKTPALMFEQPFHQLQEQCSKRHDGATAASDPQLQETSAQSY